MENIETWYEKLRENVRFTPEAEAFVKETLEKIKKLIDKEPLNVILFYLYYVLELDSKTIQKLTGINSIYSKISNFLKKHNLLHTEKSNNIEIQ